MRQSGVANWLTVVRLTIALGLALAIAPWTGLDHRAAAQTTGIDGNTYTNVLGNYSVEWDPGAWLVEEINQASLIGISLTSLDATSIGQIFHVDDPSSADAGACLDQWVKLNTQAATGVVPAQGYPPPTTVADAAGALYIDQMAGYIHYWECRQTAAETFVIISLTSLVQAYAMAEPRISTLLAGIRTEDFRDATPVDPDDAEADANDSSETGIENNVYANAEFGFSVTWDADAWSVTEVAGDTGGGIQLQGEATFGQLMASEADPQTCLEQLRDGWENQQGVSGFQIAREYDLPETEPDAIVELVSLTLQGAQGEGALLLYIECRPLDDDGSIAIVFTTEEASYETQRPIIADLLAGIVVTGPAPDPGRDTRDEPESDAASVYEDADYGFVIAWDSTLWDSETVDESDHAGLILSSDDAIIYLFVYDDGNEDAGVCLDDLIAYEEDVEGVTDFEPARGYDLPATDRDAEAALYQEVYTDEDGRSSDDLVYFECRQVNGGTLSITLITGQSVYDAVLPELEAVLADIEIGQADDRPSNRSPRTDRTRDDADDDDEDAQPAADDRYANEAYGFSVVWDPELWQAQEIDDRDTVGVALSSSNASAQLLVFDNGVEDARDCLDGMVDAEATYDGVDDVRQARALDLPATVRDAEADLLLVTVIVNDDTADYAVYLECREVDGGALAIRWTLLADTYDENVADLEALLAGIAIDGGSGPAPEPDTRTDAETGIAENRYTNVEVGFTVEWDEQVWNPEMVDDPAGVGVSLTAPDNIFIDVLAYTDAADDIGDCIDDRVTTLETALGLGDFQRERALDAPETAPDAEGELYSIEAEGRQESMAFVIYVECRPLDGGALSIVAAIPMDAYDATLDDLKAVLAGIDIQ